MRKLKYLKIYLLLFVAALSYYHTYSLAETLQPLRIVQYEELNKWQHLPVFDKPSFPPHFLNFGVIKNGQQVFFGYGCWIYDLTTKQLDCQLPKNLAQAMLSPDGKIIYGCLSDGEPYYLDTVTGKTRKAKICPDELLGLSGLHTNYKWVGTSYPERYGSFQAGRVDIFTGFTKVSTRDKSGYHDIKFSDDGRYILMTGATTRLIDAMTMHWLPLDPEFKYEKSGFNISGKTPVVFNRDISLIAVDYVFVEKGDEYGSAALVIWDRAKKKILWRKPNLSTPIAFDPSSRYIMIKGAVWDWKADKLVASGILGDVGKFSNDGRTLVTRGNKAFYLYALP
jgi:hypothetical protein